ncbi:hypothetical protein, partial [Faecalibaculum rodentium]|uniref:hypothetical protein n=1 Tax=Faecalibaculum rodentium TaxID=1702221 RepID=UPI0025A0EBE4
MELRTVAAKAAAMVARKGCLTILFFNFDIGFPLFCISRSGGAETGVFWIQVSVPHAQIGENGKGCRAGTGS